ncbi:MAG: hypothetical protein ACFFFK_12835, partial [Candidatus Thorarchaeota archaeon]
MVETARLIVNSLHKILTSDLSPDSQSLQITEAVRLAGLSFVLSPDSQSNPYIFSHLSFKAEQSGVPRDETVKLANEALKSFSYPLPENLSQTERISLLGIIHSMGCYNLPRSHNKGTSQKPLGAYYTPPEISDYIVSLTISPTLEKLAAKASTRGIEPLQEILSLRTLDPACGTGVFLISAMNAYIKAVKKGIQNALDGGITKTMLNDSGLLDF